MKQYTKLVEQILKKGSWKPASRENMPRTIGIFGYQYQHNLLDGFPLLTTKEVSFKNIFTELRWFLKGETHIKFMIDHNCNIWNEDAYNYYLKIINNVVKTDPKETWVKLKPILLECSEDGDYREFTFNEFVKCIKTTSMKTLKEKYSIINYTLGDCGKQYGWLWRNLQGTTISDVGNTDTNYFNIDQLKDVIDSLLKEPFSRRHIIDAWNPSTLNNMALHPCHVLTQFNVRKLTEEQKEEVRKKLKLKNDINIPDLILDCSMYQRSADMFLGVPYNLASYSLLHLLLCNMLGMVPGNFIHSFGDAHIYEDHISQISMQISREPKHLPKLEYSEGLMNIFSRLKDVDNLDLKRDLILETLSSLEKDDIRVKGYYPHPRISGKLSTGLKK